MKFFLLFLVIFPASEIGLFLLSANWIGVLPTVLLIILTGFLGAARQKTRNRSLLQSPARSSVRKDAWGRDFGRALYVHRGHAAFAARFFIGYHRFTAAAAGNARPFQTIYLPQAEENV